MTSNRRACNIDLEDVCSARTLLPPPLKWAGGKRWLVLALKELWRDHAQRRLVEPFVGGMAVALVSLGEFRAAIGEYSLVTGRYHGSPEVLEAYVRVAEAYRRLHQPLQARGALAQAKVVLAKLKPDAAFATATNYTREQWGERLEYLSRL